MKKLFKSVILLLILCSVSLATISPPSKEPQYCPFDMAQCYKITSRYEMQRVKEGRFRAFDGQMDMKCNLFIPTSETEVTKVSMLSLLFENGIVMKVGFTKDGE